MQYQIPRLPKQELTFQRIMMYSQTQTQSGYSSYGTYLYGAFLSILTFVVGAIILFYVVSQSVSQDKWVFFTTNVSDCS